MSNIVTRNWRDLIRPRGIHIEQETLTDFYGRFSCEPLEREEPRVRVRRKRNRLPHDRIVAMYREIGDTTKVATKLGLPRSSVWYAIHRAKQDGRLPALPGRGRTNSSTNSGRSWAHAALGHHNRRMR